MVTIHGFRGSGFRDCGFISRICAAVRIFINYLIAYEKIILNGEL